MIFNPQFMRLLPLDHMERQKVILENFIQDIAQSSQKVTNQVNPAPKIHSHGLTEA